jgi:hypothetical protein
MPARFKGTPLDYVWERATPEPNTGCWLWTYGVNASGYGVANYDNKSLVAHRLVFFSLHPGANQSLCVLHRCDQPSCVNPDHLFLGTHTENMRDAAAKGRLSRPFRGSDRPRQWSRRVRGRDPNSKLTAEDVLSIRSERFRGVIHKDIAAQFGVTKSAITQILGRKIWKNL